RTRVTLVRQDISYILPFAQRFYRDVRFNGKSAADNDADYREVTFGDLPDGGAQDIAKDVIAGKPTIVVFIGSPSGVVPTVQTVDALWPAGAGPRPTYVVADDSTEILAPFLGSSADRRRRVFAISSASVASTSHFVLRFNLAHPGEATE